MKNKIYTLIYICTITFCLFSCAPIAENATRGHQHQDYILLGFWHGAIIPFSVLGKLVGLKIGIWDSAKLFKDLSYSVGYGIALYLYYSIVKPLAMEVWFIIKTH